MYEKIHEFCSIKNAGLASRNGLEMSPRAKWIVGLLKSEGIEYRVDEFHTKRFPNNKFYNIVLPGSSNQMIVAHHDIVNPQSDNANDNSASVINVISTKKLMPNLHAVLLDGEEIGGQGSQYLSMQINRGRFGSIKWILNYELTGKGGKYFFIGNYPGPLNNHIISRLNPPVVRTPFNDAVIFRNHGIDSTVINPVPPMQNGEESDLIFNDGTHLDFSIVYNCHSMDDSLSKISTSDMKEFVEDVCVKILE